MRLDVRLEATHALDTHDAALHEALYTLFRALPHRLEPGTTLVVRTLDRPGGDVELAWEARDTNGDVEEDGRPRVLLADGPHGDLLDVALLALEECCRARMGFVSLQDGTRRVFALVPSLTRGADSYPSASAQDSMRGASR